MLRSSKSTKCHAVGHRNQAGCCDPLSVRLAGPLEPAIVLACNAERPFTSSHGSSRHGRECTSQRDLAAAQGLQRRMSRMMPGFQPNTVMRLPASQFIQSRACTRPIVAMRNTAPPGPLRGSGFPLFRACRAPRSVTGGFLINAGEGTRAGAFIGRGRTSRLFVGKRC